MVPFNSVLLFPPSIKVTTLSKKCRTILRYNIRPDFSHHHLFPKQPQKYPTAVRQIANDACKVSEPGLFTLQEAAAGGDSTDAKWRKRGEG